MTAGDGKRRWGRRAAARLLLFAVLLRALLPAGFMPDLAALQDGGFALVICTPDGFRTLPSGDGEDPGDDRDRQPPTHCAFQLGTAKGVAPPTQQVLPLPQAVPRPAQVPQPAAFPIAEIRAAPLGARAPPPSLG